MGKVIAFAALLAALLAVASATTYTTVVTTTVVDDVNPRGGGDSCMKEYEQQQKMSHCQMWMEKMGEKYMEVSFLRSAVSNPMGGEGQHLQQCCRQMENISSPCRCQVMKMMWKQQREQGSKGEMREMREMLEKLPQMCGMQMQEEQCRLTSF